MAKLGNFIFQSWLSLSLKVRGYKPCRNKNLPNRVKTYFRRRLHTRYNTHNRYGARYSKITHRNYKYYQFRDYRAVQVWEGGQGGNFGMRPIGQRPRLSKRLTWKKRIK